MREIKCKVYYQHNEIGLIINRIVEFGQLIPSLGESYNVIAKCEFISLKDKNGKEIYESDIISVDWNVLDKYNCMGNETYMPVTSRFKIFINDMIMGVQLKPLSENDSPYSADEYSWILEADVDEEDIEIIGNIYENPEFLDAHTQTILD